MEWLYQCTQRRLCTVAASEHTTTRYRECAEAEKELEGTAGVMGSDDAEVAESLHRAWTKLLQTKLKLAGA